MKRWKILLSVFVALAAASNAHAQGPSQCNAVTGNIVINCGFENNGIPGDWTPSVPLGGFFGSDGVRAHTGGGAWAFADLDGEGVFHTKAYDDANEAGYLSQTLKTIAGDSYTLSFWLFSGEGADPSPYSGGFLFSQFLANWDGSNAIVLEDYNPFLPLDPGGNLPFREFTVSGLIASSDATVLTIGGYQDISADVLDDVVVTQDQDQPTSAPEPATILLLLPGLAGAGIIARRRKPRSSAATRRVAPD